MLVAIQDMLSPPLNKLFLRALHINLAVQLLVLVPEPYGSLCNLGNAMLRDWGPSGISARVLEEMLLVFEGLNVDAPPTFLLLAEKLFELPARNPGD
jgi:hypothetical protein